VEWSFVRCAIHQDREAIAFCRSCGNALCPDCRITIGGIAYCQTCLDAGRYRPPTPSDEEPAERPPTPVGSITPTTRRNFTLGLVGMIILAVSIHILWMYPIFYFIPAGVGFLQFVPRTIGLALVVSGITLCGFAFDEFKNYFNYKWGFLIGLFTIFSLWILLIGEFLIYTGLVYIPSPYYYYYEIGPLAPLYNGLSIIGSTLFGILMILWPVALLSNRNHIRAQGITIAASVLFLITAHIILLMIPMGFQTLYFYYPFYLFGGIFSFYHAIFIEPAAIITAVIFNRLRTSVKPY
jgi:hypothetical protein